MIWHHIEKGQGRPLILLHGIGMDSEALGPVFERLAWRSIWNPMWRPWWQAWVNPCARWGWTNPWISCAIPWVDALPGMWRAARLFARSHHFDPIFEAFRPPFARTAEIQVPCTTLPLAIWIWCFRWEPGTNSGHHGIPAGSACLAVAMCRCGTIPIWSAGSFCEVPVNHSGNGRLGLPL